MIFDVNGQHVVVKEMSDKVVDIFTGTGWEGWTRFEIKRIKGKVFLQKIAGKPMDKKDYEVLCERLR